MFHLYGLFIGLAIVVGWSVGEKLEPKIGRVAPYVLIFGIVGARLYHVIDLWEYYLQNPSQIVAVWNGGLGIWGGIIGGVIATWLYFKGETLKVMAGVVVAMPLAQAIGRIGNGVNGEFVNKVWILPWWGAEAILDFVLFGILWAIREKSPKIRIGVYLVGYGLIRFVLEFWRINNWIWGSLGVAQWVSLIGVVIGLLLWLVNAQDSHVI